MSRRSPIRIAAAIVVAALAAGAGSRRLVSQTQGPVEPWPEARFADPDRPKKLAAAFPEIDSLFTRWVERQRMPGAAMGVIIDGELAWVQVAGVVDVASRAPVTPDTVFRIASMTKSFTAEAILKLRDEGKLALDDPVSRYVPELAGLPPPTRDSPALTIRHLLTHSEGFPEDNPWGDRQLAQTDETMRAWMRGGIPFSTAPGTAYEYSNYGFAILGQVVARASGQPYAGFMRAGILDPLGMKASTFEASEVPRDRLARGYKWENGKWVDEPILPHGAFGSMGGLWTSARDLARHVAFLLSAYPPRDAAETGPIRRSSAREMQQAWRAQPASATRPTVDAPLRLDAGGYGYGLRVSQNCRFAHVVQHGGGLPGYGSSMMWLPEHGVGLIALGNLTYASFGTLLADAVDALARTSALGPRVVQPSSALVAAKADVSRLLTQWDDAMAARIAADNLFLDEAAERRRAHAQELTTRHGACRPAATITAENALRGSWRMTCDRGWLNVSVTLAPTMPPRVQRIGIQSVMPPDKQMARVIETIRSLAGAWDPQEAQAIASEGFDVARMERQLQALASQWGLCGSPETVGGDGSRESAVRLVCTRGAVIARLALERGRLVRFDLTPAPGRCVP
jgi:CubicO group peptidase (beta-lactamase class C family)